MISVFEHLSGKNGALRRSLFVGKQRALSIHQKFRFEISETSRAQWNGTFRLHRPDPSHRSFCYCGFAADSKLYTKREE